MSEGVAFALGVLRRPSGYTATQYIYDKASIDEVVATLSEELSRYTRASCEACRLGTCPGHRTPEVVGA